MPTPKRQLLELLYDGDLSADVAALIKTGASWRQIADAVSAHAGVRVSYESMRQWYGKQPATPTIPVAS